MIGNLIQQQFLEGQNWPLGAAMTVAMMVALTVLMIFYLRATSTRARERPVKSPQMAAQERTTAAVAVTITVLFFAWLYLPIVAVVLFSFNSVKSLSTFQGFSTRWYSDFFHDSRCSTRWQRAW